MKKLSLLLCIFSSIFISGCNEEELIQAYHEVRGIPAQAVVNTVGQLVTAESLFSSSQYEYTQKSLEMLFLKNEYIILIEDYAFFYCYDKSIHTFKDVDFSGNYIVIGVDKLGSNLVIQGTPPFRAQWKDLSNISKYNRNPTQFESVLDIRDGECFEIELDEEYLQSLPQNKLLRKVPVEKSEWEKMVKEMKNFTTPIEGLFDSVRSEEESESQPETETMGNFTTPVEDLVDSIRSGEELESQPKIEKMILNIQSQK